MEREDHRAILEANCSNHTVVALREAINELNTDAKVGDLRDQIRQRRVTARQAVSP